MNVCALIGARSGSRGVPGKNIRPLAGHPLLAYSVRAAILAGIDRVFVSTDSTEYADIANKYEAVYVMRPLSISGDASTDYEFISHALNLMADKQPDLIVHLRPTTPFRSPAMIESAIEALAENGWASALRSVEKMTESAYKCFEIDAHKLRPVGSDSFELDGANRARQLFPPTYYPNGYVDVLRPSFIRASGLIHGDKVMPFITELTIEIDCEADFERAEQYVVAHPEIVKRLFE